MTPLSVHQKYLIEDEPDEEIFEFEENTKITFNERMIVCSYKPWQNVIQLQKTIEKLKGYKNINWINPVLNGGSAIPSRSILKNSSLVKLEHFYQT
ncbi:unnamed protein product (macronuclear) [Paramecium tetraurelia]|uniref:Uncharacterized protein n=1 Tax=Paramecium tetraurelia TaxID=5888 RepID=A0D922_PARTE|nr:uncharacterized protein GSPATT00014485001 [Paramecium tetraurelia]CAK79539.1 unnamed protein product [Paramecium tetraurelia]|eukprot:XP_001446936.1 hypothetical protein (macronuclear) [Paramecium tetraurelia strain d4-2]